MESYSKLSTLYQTLQQSKNSLDLSRINNSASAEINNNFFKDLLVNSSMGVNKTPQMSNTYKTETTTEIDKLSNKIEINSATDLPLPTSMEEAFTKNSLKLLKINIQSPQNISKLAIKEYQDISSFDGREKSELLAEKVKLAQQAAI